MFSIQDQSPRASRCCLNCVNCINFQNSQCCRAELTNWRFYHEFRTDIRSPIREPQLATLTPIMSDNGHDLASALATISAIGDREALNECISTAFPGSNLSIQLNDDDAGYVYVNAEYLSQHRCSRIFRRNVAIFMPVRRAARTTTRLISRTE